MIWQDQNDLAKTFASWTNPFLVPIKWMQHGLNCFLFALYTNKFLINKIMRKRILVKTAAILILIIWLLFFTLLYAYICICYKYILWTSFLWDRKFQRKIKLYAICIEQNIGAPEHFIVFKWYGDFLFSFPDLTSITYSHVSLFGNSIWRK